MREAQKDRSHDSTAERSTEIETSGTMISHSANDYTTGGDTKQTGFIEGLLSKGEENSISTKELLTKSGLSNVRTLQHIISQERENGALILSTITGGYFLPDTGEKGKQELSRFVATLRSRALNTLRAVKSAKRALSKQDTQIALWGQNDGAD